MNKLISAFLASESGATSIEYALIAATLGTSIVIGLQEVRAELQSTFTSVQAELKSAAN